MKDILLVLVLFISPIVVSVTAYKAGRLSGIIHAKKAILKLESEYSSEGNAHKVWIHILNLCKNL